MRVLGRLRREEYRAEPEDPQGQGAQLEGLVQGAAVAGLSPSCSSSVRARLCAVVGLSSSQ